MLKIKVENSEVILNKDECIIKSDKITLNGGK